MSEESTAFQLPPPYWAEVHLVPTWDEVDFIPSWDEVKNDLLVTEKSRKPNGFTTLRQVVEKLSSSQFGMKYDPRKNTFRRIRAKLAQISSAGKCLRERKS